MTEQKKRAPGAPKKADDEKAVRTTFSLDPDIAKKLDTIPAGKRTKLVQNAVLLYFELLEGKVSFTKTNPHSQLDKILPGKDSV